MSGGSSLCVAQTPPLPYQASDQHLGVASCASSVCHGAVQPFRDTNIQQNEFITWQTDRHGNMHAKAYTKLITPEAQSIADKLGLTAAHQAEQCLQCHTDDVPRQQRGEKFQLSDGVGCEACHGGAERWIDSHTDRQTSYADNLAQGMYPTADPVARARLCLSCHLGNKDRMMTHRIMGAGHPRLAFELDTFTYLQPHHVVDEDYIRRKGEQNGLRDWAIGQALAAQQILTLLTDAENGWNGIFPEWVLFDCHSCHRSTASRRWQARPSTGLGPGVVRVNDANLVMLRLLMLAVDPQLSRNLKQQTRQMHQASTHSRERFAQSVDTISTTLDDCIRTIQQYRFSTDDPGAIFTALIAEGRAGELTDYMAGEQAAMAAVNIISTYERLQLIDSGPLSDDIDRIFASVENHDDYRAQQLVAALSALGDKLP